jgi:peptidyl-prolyl cis-trans isomerase C
MKVYRRALLAAPLLLGACGGFGSAMTSHTDVVARAAGKELRVEDAAQLLARNPQIPGDPQVVHRLAELWVEYTLLATAMAEDSTLAGVDLERLVQDQREDQTLFRFLETNLRPDTVFTDQELERLWEAEGPGVEVKARHILMMSPADATPEQRRASQERAEAVRQRAAAGADFATLAAETTEEPGGRDRGGDLGWFGRGRMVPQFETAAFGLQPGQVSPVVESPFGYHVIKVEDRRQQPLGENRDMFRQELSMQRRQQAVNSYIDSLKAAAEVQVQPGAVDQVRELAGQDSPSPRGRAASREMVAFRGGSVTAAEVASALQNLEPQQREGLRDQATAEQVEAFLEEQALRELVLAEAAARNFRLSDAAVDSIRIEARQWTRDVLEMAGFAGRSFPRGRAGDGAIQEAVRNLMEQAIAGQRRIGSLGPLGTALRGMYPSDVNTGSFQRVADRMQAIRAAQPQQPAPAFPPPPEGAPPSPERAEPRPEGQDR